MIRRRIAEESLPGTILTSIVYGIGLAIGFLIVNSIAKKKRK